jgi:hypothetical protein
MKIEMLTCGSYCPACGWSITKTAAGRFPTLDEWEKNNHGAKCSTCGEPLMPHEFPASEAGGVWAMLHSHD